ncbi:MAG: mechanosensitive ion channel domain-containing protein [Armatimonadia bacterium]
MDKQVAQPQVQQNPWEMMQWWLQHPEMLLGRLILMVLVLALAIIIYALVRRVLRRLQRDLTLRGAEGPAAQRRRAARSLTVISLLGSVAKWVIFLSAIIWILAIGGMNLLPVLTGAGIAGLAIGLGAQSLIRDFFSGFFMMLEGQFAVGDYVTINGIFGTVQEVGLRVTVLADPTEKLHYLPNGGITTVAVWDEPRQGYGLQLELMQAGQVDLAAQTLGRVLEEVRADFPRQLLGFETPSGQVREDGTGSVRALLQVFPDQGWVAQEELPARLLARLKQIGVEVGEEVKPRVHADLTA